MTNPQKLFLTTVLACVISLQCVAQNANYSMKQITDSMLHSIFGGDKGLSAAGITKLSDKEKASLLRPYNVLLRDSKLGDSAVRYLEGEGWKRYYYEVYRSDLDTILLVKEAGSIRQVGWITKSPFMLHGSGECLGSGGLLSGPTEIITDSGKHSLLLAKWSEVKIK